MVSGLCLWKKFVVYMKFLLNESSCYTKDPEMKMKFQED
jgi:hypothetical protein